MKRITFRNQILMITGLAVISLVINAGTGFAQDFKKYRNNEFGYSLFYPQSFHLSGGGKLVNILSSRDGRKAGRSAGVTIRVDAVEPADQENMDKTAERLAGEIDENLQKDLRFSHPIGNRDWYGFNYITANGKINGELCILIRDGRVFSIKTFYQGKDAMSRFHHQVSDILDSFSFAATGYLTYRNPQRGVSFRCPDNLRITDETSVLSGMGIHLILAGTGRGDYPHSTIGINMRGVSNTKARDMDEFDLINALKNQKPGSRFIVAPRRVALARYTWIHSEIHSDDGVVVSYLRRIGKYFIEVSFSINPHRDELEDREIWKIFLESLTLNEDKWIEYMEKRNKKRGGSRGFPPDPPQGNHHALSFASAAGET